VNRSVVIQPGICALSLTLVVPIAAAAVTGPRRTRRAHCRLPRGPRALRRSQPESKRLLAVTDHAETLGEVQQCSKPQLPGYSSDASAKLRAPAREPPVPIALATFFDPNPRHLEEICGAKRSAIAKPTRMSHGLRHSGMLSQASPILKARAAARGTRGDALRAVHVIMASRRVGLEGKKPPTDAD